MPRPTWISREGWNVPSPLPIMTDITSEATKGAV
jgi:hypothetical protein